MKIFLEKTSPDCLRPASPADEALLARIAIGRAVAAEVTQPRNYRFHKKFFALLTLGFDAWEPAITEYEGYEVQKDFDSFRDDVTIAAGFFTVTTNLQGRIRLRPKSISFANMEQEAFERLYSNVANVLLQRILVRYTRADLDAVINRLLGF